MVEPLAGNCFRNVSKMGEPMRVHKLKTDPNVFALSFCGSKPWEIRKNDRDFKVGDLIILQETVFSGEEMYNGKPLEYTGRELSRIVNLIVSGYGLSDGWVVMTVDKI